MKKFFSLVLALVMALSLTTAAWGAEDYNYNTGVPGKALVLTAGVAYDGNNATLQDAALTGSYDAGVVLTGTGAQSVKNVKIVGVTRGIESGYEVDTTSITIDNVVVEDCVRAMHINTAAAANLYVSNSTFEGKISFDLHGGTATFVNCTFKYDAVLDAAKGNMVESYDDVVFENCTFEDGFEVSFENFAAGDELAMTDCFYDGDPLTADNMDELFSNTGSVTVADVVSVVHAADGATTGYTGLYAGATSEGANVVAITGLNFFKAVDNEVDEDGEFEDYGNVAYYTVSGDQYFTGKYYVEVKTLAKADVVVSTDAAGKDVYMYLDEIVDPFYYGDGVVTKNFGTACGQYNSKNAAYDKKATYYVAFETLYVGDKVSPTEWLMVNGQLVGVDVAFDDVVAHAPVYTRDENSEIVAIKCSKCGASAVKAPNFLSMPKDADRVGTTLWYFTAATTGGTSTDKVTSAETFDAGIAMYVGMSVMAAAGSAVVLKKRED